MMDPAVVKELEAQLRETESEVRNLADLLDDDSQTAGMPKPLSNSPIQRAHAMNRDADRASDDLIPQF